MIRYSKKRKNSVICKKDAGNILSHICNARCKNRIDHNNNAADSQCRKTSNLKVIPDNTKNSYVSLPNKHTPEFIQRLAQIGLITHIHLIDDFPTGEFYSDNKFLQPTIHIPPTNPTHDRYMSHVEGYRISQ